MSNMSSPSSSSIFLPSQATVVTTAGQTIKRAIVAYQIRQWISNGPRCPCRSPKCQTRVPLVAWLRSCSIPPSRRHIPTERRPYAAADDFVWLRELSLLPDDPHQFASYLKRHQRPLEPFKVQILDEAMERGDVCLTGFLQTPRLSWDLRTNREIHSIMFHCARMGFTKSLEILQTWPAAKMIPRFQTFAPHFLQLHGQLTPQMRNLLRQPCYSHALNHFYATNRDQPVAKILGTLIPTVRNFHYALMRFWTITVKRRIRYWLSRRTWVPRLPPLDPMNPKHEFLGDLIFRRPRVLVAGAGSHGQKGTAGRTLATVRFMASCADYSAHRTLLGGPCTQRPLLHWLYFLAHQRSPAATAAIHRLLDCVPLFGSWILPFAGFLLQRGTHRCVLLGILGRCELYMDSRSYGSMRSLLLMCLLRKQPLYFVRKVLHLLSRYYGHEMLMWSSRVLGSPAVTEILRGCVRGDAAGLKLREIFLKSYTTPADILGYIQNPNTVILKSCETFQVVLAGFKQQAAERIQMGWRRAHLAIRVRNRERQKLMERPCLKRLVRRVEERWLWLQGQSCTVCWEPRSSQDRIHFLHGDLRHHVCTSCFTQMLMTAEKNNVTARCPLCRVDLQC